MGSGIKRRRWADVSLPVNIRECLITHNHVDDNFFQISRILSACEYDLTPTFFHSHNFLNMPYASLHRTLVFGIWARKLCDIYSSIGCALSSFRPPLGPPFDFLLNFCSCQTARCFNKSKGVLITGLKLKAFRNPQPSWGFSIDKQNVGAGPTFRC